MSARRVAIGWPWLIVWASVVFALVDAAPAGAFGCLETPVTIVGTPGDDVLVETNGPDVDYARAGNDLIRGRKGGDIICAGRGADIVYGGPGMNTILGGMDDDVLVGAASSEVRFGGFGDDLLVGHENRDFLGGGDGLYVLRGGWGHDVLDDGRGDDFVFGGLGSDEFEFRGADPGGDDFYSSGGGIRDALLLLRARLRRSFPRTDRRRCLRQRSLRRPMGHARGDHASRYVDRRRRHERKSSASGPTITSKGERATITLSGPRHRPSRRRRRNRRVLRGRDRSFLRAPLRGRPRQLSVPIEAN